MELLQRRETIIRQWFSMWLTGQNRGVESIFSPDATYVESWGPSTTELGQSSFGLRNGIPVVPFSNGISSSFFIRVTRP